MYVCVLVSSINCVRIHRSSRHFSKEKERQDKQSPEIMHTCENPETWYISCASQALPCYKFGVCVCAHFFSLVVRCKLYLKQLYLSLCDYACAMFHERAQRTHVHM